MEISPVVCGFWMDYKPLTSWDAHPTSTSCRSVKFHKVKSVIAPENLWDRRKGSEVYAGIIPAEEIWVWFKGLVSKMWTEEAKPIGTDNPRGCRNWRVYWPWCYLGPPQNASASDFTWNKAAWSVMRIEITYYSTNIIYIYICNEVLKYHEIRMSV